MNATDLLRQGDAVSMGVAMVLLVMSVASWVVILWKAWLLLRAHRDVARSTAAFWQAPSLEEGLRSVQLFDREVLVTPLVEASRAQTSGTLAGAGDKSQQLTRLLRDALHTVLLKLQAGQVLLATVGSTAPFVGLLGTVWGIYHALMGISGAGQVSIDQISGPVGEALIMTAAGLAVAIPAVLAYNAFTRVNRVALAELDGFAHDLLGLVTTGSRVHVAPGDSLRTGVVPMAKDTQIVGH